MDIYMAPMEGLTGFVYRNAYAKVYGDIDKYFTPFISATVSKRMKTKEMRDVSPEKNIGIFIVPQLMANDPLAFKMTADRLYELGYGEINLNVGCPSATVTSRGRGAGFLAKKEELDIFFEEIFKNTKQKISVKTRLGMSDPDEFDAVLEIFNKYPIYELIIHPRTRNEFYSGSVHLDKFLYAVDNTNLPLCYNGDINTLADFEKTFAKIKVPVNLMLGRGLLADPALPSKIKKTGKNNDRDSIAKLHYYVYNGYKEIMGKDAVFRMKELWHCMIKSVEDNEVFYKKIKKSKGLNDYESVVTEYLGEASV